MKVVAPRDSVSLLIKQAKALVFDFDGTLVDSNEIKWRGFESVFKEFSDRLDKIMSYCRSANHTMRSDKFRHVYESILRLPYTPEIAQSIHDRYTAVTTRAIIDAPEISGASSFLRGLRGRYTMALLSSTPHQVLLEILHGRRWLDFFDYMRGAPVNKSEWLLAFRKTHALKKEQLLVFGDTYEDADAARAAGCTFIAVATDVIAPASLSIDNYLGLAV